MALSVKSYLNYEGSEPEIRRFSMPQDVSASYEYLVEKIRRVYPSLLRKDFQLYWRDEENELIAFSSDDELVMALGSISQGNFRVYIKEHEDSTDGTSGGNKKETHPGVVCDVCDKEIAGTRFKCLSCPDYDLCSQCEGKGFHPEHEMLRIRKPTRNPWQGFWHTVFGPRGHHRGRGCHMRGMRGRHGGRPHCPPPFAPNFPGFDPRTGGGAPGCPGFDPRVGGGAGCPFGFPWNTPSGESRPGQNAEDKEGNKQEKSDSNTSEQQMPTFEEIFTQVSEVARQFMNPDHFNSWGSDDSQSCSEPNDVPIRKEEGEKADEGKGEYEDSPMPNESFVVVDKEKEEGKRTKASENQQNVTQRRKEEEEFERRLDEAIKQMEAMGFNNENGWLTQLLIAKDFDIGRVIDTLQLKQN